MSDGSITQPSSVLRPAPKFSKTTFHFLAGLTSGLTSSILLQPADLLKTRVQQSGSSALLPTLKAIVSGPNPILSLWRGTLPSALRTGFGSALYFTTLNALRTSVATGHLEKAGSIQNVVLASVKPIAKSSSALPKLSHFENLTTGAAARTLAGLIMMPVTVLKVRYESSYYAYNSLWGACRDIMKTEGPKGFFAGFGATAVRDAPYAGLYVVFYEGSKKRLSALATTGDDGVSAIVPTKSKTAATHFVSGILAAGLATAVTNPFDAVKTRLQLQPAKYRNMVHATKLMLKQDGPKSFLDGLGLRMGRKALSSALAWTVYEDLIARAERRFEESKEGVL